MRPSSPTATQASLSSYRTYGKRIGKSGGHSRRRRDVREMGMTYWLEEGGGRARVGMKTIAVTVPTRL